MSLSARSAASGAEVIKWYQLSPEEALRALRARSTTGLSSAEAKDRRLKYGANTLPQPKPDHMILVFIKQFASPLIYLLLAAAGVMIFMHEPIDAGVVLFVLLFNASIGTYQEGRAQQTFQALNTLTETFTTVLRDGVSTIIPSAELVPGDIVMIHEGDKVPADLRILESRGIVVNEAALTGESEPVMKQSLALEHSDPQHPEGLSPADQRNMVFRGTAVAAGSGQGLVVATGTKTVIGGIAQHMKTEVGQLPLKHEIEKLARVIMLCTAVLSIALFVFGIFKGNSSMRMFATVVSLAVSVIPEGLPVVLTLVLAGGVWRMSKRNVLVKKLQAVEALAHVSVIAVDKTGTITKNQLAVQQVYVDGRYYTVTGVGYDPEGEVLYDDKPIARKHVPEKLGLLAQIAALCSGATLTQENKTKQWMVGGDPTEAALHIFAQKLGYARAELLKQHELLHEIPFSSVLRVHVVLQKYKDKGFLAVVGAPETMMDISTLSHSEKEQVERAIQSLSQQGLRVVACGYTLQNQNMPKHIHSLKFVGLIGMKDGLQKAVDQVVKRIHFAGIRLIMITGDHRTTAEAIAREAGIYSDGDEVMIGDDFAHVSEEVVREKIKKTSVFARVAPEHKMKIIQMFQQSGASIAMTGDGVNDAPSLVAADLGIAMGNMGTEVAREASDIVLLDDNLKSVIAAVEEGRNMLKTIKRVVLYLLSTGIGEALTISTVLLSANMIPLLPTQIIWLNFVTDGFLDLSLAMEPKRHHLLEDKRFFDTKAHLLDQTMIFRGLLMGLTMAAGAVIVFFRHDQHSEITLTMTLTTLAAYQWFNAWNCRSERRSLLSMNIFENQFLVGATVLVVLLQVAAVHVPLMNKILHTAPLSIEQWTEAIVIAFSVVIVEEIRKYIVRLLEKK